MTDEKKPRDGILRVDFGDEPVMLTRLSAPNERGDLVFYGADGKPLVPRRIEVGTSYQRAKGPKIITLAVANPSDIKLDVNHHLTSYDWVFCVDTNTKTIGNEVVSVTGVVHVRDIELRGAEWSAMGVPGPLLETRDARVPPERLGWRHLLWDVSQQQLEGKIAVFVDSELNELAAINKREKELLPGYFLPENVTLIYASSDVGRGELVGNKAIAQCDRYASNLIAQLERGDVPVPVFHTNMLPYCRRYRIWPPPTPL